MNYYCGMRDELTSLFSKEIILEDGGHYFYAIQPFEMKNMLGAVVAVLNEYLFTKSETSETYKLYRTKEGNWYEISNSFSVENIPVLRELKTVITMMEANV